MTLLYQARFDAPTLPKVMPDLAEVLGGVGAADRRLRSCVRELADNAIHHSGQNGGWVFAERTDEAITVTVHDRGMGIHSSMSLMYPDINERTALITAFGMGVSGAFDDPDRGLGLMLQYTRSGTYLLLESGGLALVGSEGKGQVIGKSTQRVPGVVATLILPQQS